MAGRSTIADVARAAAVSPATVSRVLNGSATVSGELADRVREAAGAVGYQPFGPARALRMRRTPVWTVVVADVENPFFTSVVRGVEEVARAHGNRLVLGNADEDVDQEAGYLDIAVAEHMAGVVLAPASAARTDLGPVLDAGIPVVAIDRRPARHAVDAVVVDNRAGAADAADHLVAAGYEHPACITGPEGISTADDRLDGFAAALGRRPLVQRADFRREGGYRATARLLARRRRPDALFVANNLMTLGALQAVRDAGLRIGRDVGVVGFDDAPWAPLVEPPLTVVAQPAREIGRCAGELLATAAERREPRVVVLSPTLVVRGSSTRQL